MDPLDELELRAFEHLYCPGCAVEIREFVERQLASGDISIDDVKTMAIEVIEDE